MIYAIISLYNPNKLTISNVSNICAQVDFTYLCDNSSTSNKQLFQGIRACSYLLWNQNLGLSKAFNKVLKNNMNQFDDDDYIIFFDQDSVIRDEHINNLIIEYNMLEKKGYRIGCLGPIFYNTSRGEVEIAKNKKQLYENCYSVQSLITSSMLCKYKSLRNIGFWNEDLFLDMADWDLCWRFIEQNYLCCVTKNVLLYHSVGESEKKVGILRLRVGKPFREYYQVRESLYLLHKKYTPFKFRIRFIELLTIRSLMHLLFLDNKKERLYYIQLGIKDYKKNVHGALDKVY